MSKTKSALAFAAAAAVSAVIYVSLMGGLLGPAVIPMALGLAPLAALSAFVAYFIVARGFWSRIGRWQLRAVLFGIAVVLVAHLLLGTVMYLAMREEDRELLIGLWLFVATSFVTLPFGIGTACVLEAKRRSLEPG